jgi:hypothetical protein
MLAILAKLGLKIGRSQMERLGDAGKHFPTYFVGIWKAHVASPQVSWTICLCDEPFSTFIFHPVL